MDHDAASDTVDQYYGAAGEMTKRVDQRSIQTAYLYDSLGRLTKKQDDPTNPTTVEEYAHDSLGRMTLAKLSRGGAEHAETKYYYDGLSRPTRESQKIKAGTARNLDMAYDVAGNRTRLAYPGASSEVVAHGRKKEELGRMSPAPHRNPPRRHYRRSRLT